MKNNGRPVYIDIDGTLTTEPTIQWGPVIPERIAKVKKMMEAGESVVLWTGGGTIYANAFAKAHGLGSAICIGKPDLIVDDNPTIRPKGRMPILSPGEFFKDG